MLGMSSLLNSSQVINRSVLFALFLQQLMLDSPALIDLSHGTVRYRHPDEKRGEENAHVKTGYFYHPRLDDFSEGIISIRKNFAVYIDCLTLETFFFLFVVMLTEHFAKDK